MVVKNRVSVLRRRRVIVRYCVTDRNGIVFRCLLESREEGLIWKFGWETGKKLPILVSV